MIVLDYRDKRPIYEQIVDKPEYLIICGALEYSGPMPNWSRTDISTLL